MFGCAAQQAARDDRAGESILATLRSCMDTSSGSKTAAPCALQFYESINANISDSNPEKGPILVMARKLYAVLLKSDRGEFRSSEERRLALMVVHDEFRADLQKARLLSEMQLAAEAQRQRQLFLEAQRQLSPRTSTVLQCERARYGPSGTIICQ